MEDQNYEKGISKHPMEDEDSGKRLQVAVFNLISLGEWEAAGCILRSLAAREDTKLKAKQLLRALVVTTNDYWKFSKSVPSPSHLSWLALQMFLELFPEHKSDIPDTVTDLIKFLLLLYSTRSTSGHTHEIEEWLSEYYRQHVVAMVPRPVSPPHVFPSSIQGFLRTLIQTNPALGHAVLSALTISGSPHYLSNNETLQLLYIECIDISLGKIEGIIDEEADPSVDKEVNCICDYLSLLDPTPEMTKVVKNVDRIFLKLMELKRPFNNVGLDHLFKPKLIYSCLVGRSSPLLVQRFQDIEEFLRASQESDEVDVMESLESGKYWKSKFYRATKQKQHFLETALETGIQLVCSLQLDHLSTLMSDPVLYPIKPLLLLMGWDRKPDIGKGKDLLDVLWPQTSDVQQPLLYNGCCKLAFQVGLVQWCLDRARPFMPSGPTSLPQTSAGDVFQGLKSHSVLYVLHHSTPLHSLDPLEVIDILKLQPESSLPLSRRPSPSPGQTYNPSSPRIPGKELITLTSEQKRDIATYRSFCCLKLIMESIWSSVLMIHGLLLSGKTSAEESDVATEESHGAESFQRQDKERKEKTKVVRRLEYGVEDSESASQKPKTLSSPEDAYVTEVTNRLDRARAHLSEIFPLHFRLEMLENIFSLLFVTSDDLPRTEKTDSFGSTVMDSVKSSASTEAESDILNTVHSVTFIRKQQGFLVNERFAFDLLNLLNDAIFELTATKFSLLNPSNGDPSKNSNVMSSTNSVIQSSINPGILQQRLAKLQKCINEAKWRLQLVSSKSGIVCTSTREGQKEGVSSDEESMSDLSDEEEGLEQEEEKEACKARPKELLKSLENSKASSPTSVRSRPSSRLSSRPSSHGLARTPSGNESRSSQPEKKAITSTTDEIDYSSGHCADIEEGSPEQRSKRSKKTRSMRSESLSKSRKSPPYQKGSGIVCHMLASPHSLLCMCLKHGNYHRAREVLKMFNLEGELEDHLVQFAEQFEIVCHDLNIHSKSSTPRPSPSSITPITDMNSTSSLTPPMSSLQIVGGASEGSMNLQAAIISAHNSSPVIDSVSRLVAPANLREVVFAGNPELTKNAMELPLISLLLDNVPSLVMVDILSSSHLEGQTAKKIVNLAVTRSRSALEGLSPKIGDSHPGGRRSFQERKTGVGLDKPLQGPIGLLHVLSEVSGYFVLSSPVRPFSPGLPTSIISSPHSLLTKFLFPLSINTVQQWKEFSDAYWETRDQLEEIVGASSSQGDILELLSDPMADQHKAKDVFSSVLQSMKLFPLLNSRESEEKGTEPRVMYLYLVSKYLTKFVKILMKTLGVAPKATPTQMLAVIRESPTQVIGRLLFEKSISPERLEKLVSDLPHLKIVEVIVKCCCPRVPSLCYEGGPSLSAEGGGVYPLNLLASDFGGTEDNAEKEDPCELSHKLLSKMIATLKGLCVSDSGSLTAKDLLAAGQTTEMKKVLQCTSKLSSITLSSLKNNTPRQISFFSNVTNLLYGHALMMFLNEEGTGKGIKMMGGARLSANVLQSDKVAMVTLFTRVGYYIGELGLVSLYDLHYTILRQGLSLPSLDKKNMLKLRPGPLGCDLWSEYVPGQTEPRVLYVVSNGTLSSPIPRLLLPEHLQSELESAEARFIRANVTFDLAKSVVRVPKLLSVHRNDFIPSKKHYKEEDPFRNLSDIALVNYIISKLPKETADQYRPMVEYTDKNRKGLELKLEVIEEDLTIGYDFPTSRRTALEDGPSPLSLRHQPKSTPVRRYERLKSYKFTEDTVSFVQQQAPLLASLVCLLCPPESLSSLLDFMSSDDVIEEDTDDEKRVAFVQTLGSLVKPKPKERPLKRVLSSSNEENKTMADNAPELWQETFDKLSTLFNDGTPLKNFLTSRLVSFRGVLPWDRLIQEPLKEEGSVGDMEDPAINLRMLAVLPGRSLELSHACMFVLRKLLRKGMQREALEFLKTEPIANNRDSVQSVINIVLSCCFVTEATARDKTNRGKEPELSPLVLAHQISDVELACRLVLPYLEVWPAVTCVKLLKWIHYHLPSSSVFVAPVNQQLHRLHVYLQIIETVERPDDVTSQPRPCPWKHWSELVFDSKERKEYVLDNLLKNKAFGLAREWAQVHGHGDEVKERIEEEYIHDLLEGTEDSSDTYRAQGALEDLPSDAMKLKICDGLLEKCHRLESVMLVLQFILGHLDQLHSAKQLKLANQLLGVKALLVLPHFVREQYRPLMGEPLLIIEQLLIDLKIEWVGKILKVLSEDEYASYIDTKDTPLLEPRPSVLTDEIVDPFFPLLMFYAEKSLAIPSPSVVNTPASSRGGSPSRFGTPFHSRMRSPTNEMPSRYSTIPPTPRRRSSFGKYYKYEPPETPPPKDKWEPDAKANYCRVCTSTYFGMFSRRHHCRRCGRVICGPCSAYQMRVEGYVGHQRVCRDCHNHHILISGSTDEDPIPEQEDTTDMSNFYPGLGGSSQYAWRLIPQDHLFNQNLRKEFCYESSPSISLCVSITDLISNTRIGAGFLMHCCHSVSLQLVPDDHGRVNEELDHYFTINMMESLLMNAKLRYTQSGDSSGVELCDTYLSRVDLLRLLVSSQFSEIPSIQELARPELARRVRDRLLADDRFKLAMDVSTKCQLDATPVWSSWGMACIRAGEFSRAKELLRHCFQVSSSQSFSSSSSSSSYLLERIIEQISTCPLSSVGHKEDWSENIKSTLQLTENRHEVALMDNTRFNECCYYVTTYGSPAMIVSFYSKHSCWKEACQYILTNNCSSDVFVDNLWIPALKSGHLEHLEEALFQLDMSLARWEPYMTAVCRLLSKRRLYHILYHMQLFMKDYVRAAMTCIKFYIGFSGRSTTIKDLYQRRKYLETAKQHFESSIEIPLSRGRMFGHSAEEQSRASLLKNTSPQELQMHIHTVCLQLKITELLHSSAVENNTLNKPLSVVGGGRGEGHDQPATLFSTGVVRGEVICNMLSSCENLPEGFQVTFEAISAYRLPVQRIFCDVAKQLAQKEKYQDVYLLLHCLQKSPLASSTLNDEVCLSAIRVLATQSKEVQSNQQLEKLIKATINDRNKIKALIQCGRLKNAYLVAINANLPDEVRNIADVASKAGQLGVRDICNKWLSRQQKK